MESVVGVEEAPTVLSWKETDRNDRSWNISLGKVWRTQRSTRLL